MRTICARSGCENFITGSLVTGYPSTFCSDKCKKWSHAPNYEVYSGGLNYPEKTQGIKHDSSKLRYDLINPVAQEAFVKVLTYGANKYAPRNWEKGIDKDRLIAAAYRHIESYRQGEKIDKESNQDHIAHAICCLHFLLSLELDKSLPGFYHIRKGFDYSPITDKFDFAEMEGKIINNYAQEVPEDRPEVREEVSPSKATRSPDNPRGQDTKLRDESDPSRRDECFTYIIDIENIRAVLHDLDKHTSRPVRKRKTGKTMPGMSSKSRPARRK